MRRLPYASFNCSKKFYQSSVIVLAENYWQIWLRRTAFYSALVGKTFEPISKINKTNKWSDTQTQNALKQFFCFCIEQPNKNIIIRNIQHWIVLCALCQFILFLCLFCKKKTYLLEVIAHCSTFLQILEPNSPFVFFCVLLLLLKTVVYVWQIIEIIIMNVQSK